MGKTAKFTTKYLDKLIEEATTDAYNESEQAGGFFAMIEENLALPFVTQVLGQEVTVAKLDITKRDEIVLSVKRQCASGNPLGRCRSMYGPIMTASRHIGHDTPRRSIQFPMPNQRDVWCFVRKTGKRDGRQPNIRESKYE